MLNPLARRNRDINHGCRLRRGDRQCRRDRRLVGQARNGRIRQSAEPKHLPSFRHRDAGLPGLGLARLQHALRHRLAFKQVGVPFELLGGKNVLRDGMQIVALQRHEARALQRDERLAGVDPIAASNRQTLTMPATGALTTHNCGVGITIWAG